MNSTIWKFPLKITDEQTVLTPRSAQILTVQDQRGTACLWAWVDPSEEVQPRTIRMFGTGHPIETKLGKYIGTIQHADDLLVWHVFEDG